MMVIGEASEATVLTRNRRPSGDGSYFEDAGIVNSECGGPASRIDPRRAMKTAINCLPGAR